MGKKAEQSQTTYDKMALEYDSMPEGKYTRDHKAELIKKVVVRDGDTILDVACGNGLLLAELSKKAKVNAFGVDISENMIAVAKKRYPNCTFIAQPCFPLRFENRSMDVITVSCAFHHFEKPQGFADECMRILKDDGKIYMAEPYFPLLYGGLPIRWYFRSRIMEMSEFTVQKICVLFLKKQVLQIFKLT